MPSKPLAHLPAQPSPQVRRRLKPPKPRNDYPIMVGSYSRGFDSRVSRGVYKGRINTLSRKFGTPRWAPADPQDRIKPLFRPYVNGTATVRALWHKPDGLYRLAMTMDDGWHEGCLLIHDIKREQMDPVEKRVGVFTPEFLVGRAVYVRGWTRCPFPRLAGWLMSNAAFRVL